MSNKVHINKTFLQSGKDLKITSSLSVRHPLVQDILDLDIASNGYHSEEMYYSLVSVFICDPYNYMIYLDDKNIDYETMDSFDLFIMLYEDTVRKYETEFKPILSEENYNTFFMNNIYYKSFQFFLNKQYFIIAKDENGNKVIGDYDTHCVMIDREIFSYITEFIKQINGIYEIDKVNPEDDFAKQILIEDERSRIKKEYKNKDIKNNDRLGNLLSAITWAGKGGITPFNRNNLHMYDLFDGINRTDKLLHFNHTMNGLYSGCVDKDKINYEQISWRT